MPSRIGPMQAAWISVGFRIAIAPNELASHLSIPSSVKLVGSGIFGVGECRERFPDRRKEIRYIKKMRLCGTKLRLKKSLSALAFSYPNHSSTQRSEILMRFVRISALMLSVFCNIDGSIWW